MCSTYVTTMGVYGYYRGFNNLHDGKNYNIKEKLLIDRIINGLFGCLWQMNPAMQPFLIYGILRRYEKKCIN